jgi:hypothetical protein
MSDHDQGEHVKEVCARFGLAVYCAQVLEHGLVNAFKPSAEARATNCRFYARPKNLWRTEPMSKTIGLRRTRRTAPLTRGVRLFLQRYYYGRKYNEPDTTLGQA